MATQCCLGARAPPEDPGTILAALYLLPRPASVAYSVNRIPAVLIALQSLEARGTWGGLPHITLTSFASSHVGVLSSLGAASAAAGTAVASPREPYNIGIRKWARHTPPRGSLKETWDIWTWCPVLGRVVDVIGREGAVVGARKLNVKRRQPKLHMGFGQCGGKVGDADMTRALAMWEWDVVLVTRTAGDVEGRELEVQKRWAVGPVVGEIVAAGTYSQLPDVERG